MTLASVCWNLLHLIQVNLEKERNVCLFASASFEFSHPLQFLLLQHLSRDSVNIIVL
jgi:hypothetical protein